MDPRNEIDQPEEDTFEKRLSPLTSKYLASQTQMISQNQSLDKIDLRHMCENVINLEKVLKALGHLRASYSRERGCL